MPTRRKHRTREREQLLTKRPREPASNQGPVTELVPAAPRSLDTDRPSQASIYRLQHSIGNRAVGGLLAQRSEPEREERRVTQPPAPTGPVPTPYPHTAATSGAKQTSQKVRMKGKETATKKAEMPKSSGDEAGTLKGMVSNAAMDAVRYKSGSSKVHVKHSKVVKLTTDQTSPTSQPGTPLTPSRAKKRLEDE